jgi:hypothetical protein
LPCCRWGHRVGDGPVPQLSATAAVTIAADLTTSGSSRIIRNSRKRNRRQRSPRQGRLGLRLARAWGRRSWLTRPIAPDLSAAWRERTRAPPCRAAVGAIVSATAPYLSSAQLDRRRHQRRRPHQRIRNSLSRPLAELAGAQSGGAGSRPTGSCGRGREAERDSLTRPIWEAQTSLSSGAKLTPLEIGHRTE